MTFLARMLIQAVAILLIAYLVPRLIQVDGFTAALVAAFILGVVNTFLRPLLVLLTLPINILTLGLFLLVINGLMLWLVSSLVRGFQVNGFFGAFFGALLISLVTWVLDLVVR
jgi:putative membrane protein